MTIIAYKDGVLAVDSRGQAGDTLFITKKYRVIPGKAVLAVSGNLTRGIEVMDWYENGADPEKWPAAQNSPEWARMIVMTKDDVVEYEDRPFALPRLGPYNAWGAGREAALGAMHAGATAEQAAYAAIEHVAGCGGPVHVFRQSDL